MKKSNKLLKRAGFEEDFDGVDTTIFVKTDPDNNEHVTLEITKYKDDEEAQIDFQAVDLDTLLVKYGFTLTATLVGGLALKLKDRH